MLLKDWLFENDWSKAKLARKLNVPRSRITEYFKGINRFTTRKCEEIEKLTEGKVTRSEAMWPELYDSSYVFKTNKEKEF